MSEEEFDEYEMMLKESADPADHLALKIRMVLREAGIDPDSDDWWITGHKAECPDLKVEPQITYKRPVITRPYVMNPPEGYTFSYHVDLEKVSNKEVWCVKHRGGWCALVRQTLHESQYRDNMKTKCGHFVVMTWAIEKRVPTCEECLKIMDIDHGGKNG